MRPTRRDRTALDAALERLPELSGGRIEICFSPELRARRGRLHSGPDQPGVPVHAGAFIRQRRIVLDSALRPAHGELTRVLLHELFHFAWVRLGNPARGSWERLLRAEYRGCARGELGWSAEMRKRKLLPGSERAWRDYICESFCDTAAWFYGGLARHDEFTLARRHRDRRAGWFETNYDGWPVPI